jgi:hypothetical protein
MMKKPYGEPTVTVLGTVADLTEQVPSKCFGSVDNLDPGSTLTRDEIIGPGETCADV